MNKVLVLVDNGFFKLVRKSFELKSGKKKMFLQTFRNICKNEDLEMEHLFVYMAPPFQSRIPINVEKLLRKKYDSIKKMLDKKEWITVREGRCQKIVDNKGIRFNQKGVDSWIVADMCLFKEDSPDVDKIILISSDSDFAPIIEMIQKKKNIEVILYTYFDKDRNSFFFRSNHLLKSCSKWIKLREEDFKNKE